MLLSYVLTVVSLSGVSLRPSCGTAICYNICVDCRQAVPPEQLSLPLAPRPAVWYPILTKRRRVPGAFERLAGRIGKQVQSLYGTAAVRGGSSGQRCHCVPDAGRLAGAWGALFAPTLQVGRPAQTAYLADRPDAPAVHTARRPKACRVGGKAGPAPRTDQTPVRKNGSQTYCGPCERTVF